MWSEKGALKPSGADAAVATPAAAGALQRPAATSVRSQRKRSAMWGWRVGVVIHKVTVLGAPQAQTQGTTTPTVAELSIADISRTVALSAAAGQAQPTHGGRAIDCTLGQEAVMQILTKERALVVTLWAAPSVAAKKPAQLGQTKIELESVADGSSARCVARWLPLPPFRRANPVTPSLPRSSAQDVLRCEV